MLAAKTKNTSIELYYFNLRKLSLSNNYIQTYLSSQPLKFKSKLVALKFLVFVNEHHTGIRRKDRQIFFFP